MKIAATFNDGEIFQHFGHCEQFKIYEIKDNKIIKSGIISSVGEGHGALSLLLAKNNIDALVCGGIGGGAREALKEANIKLYPGVTGSADVAVEKLLNGTLEYNENATCSHHGHLGEHKCGENKHGCMGH